MEEGDLDVAAGCAAGFVLAMVIMASLMWMLVRYG